MPLRPYFITPGCVLSLRMMEGAGNHLEDSSGYGNHGVLGKDNGTYPQWVQGKFPSVTNDYALDFDGLGAWVNCGNNNSLNITGELTVEAWFKAPDAQAGEQKIVSKGDFNDDGYQMFYDGTGDRWYFELDRAGSNDGCSFSWPRDSKWHHIVGTAKNTDRLDFYFDSVRKCWETGIGTWLGSTKNLIVGAYYTHFEGFFNGIIDEVRVYNRALSADEILAHYNNGRNPPSR